MASVTADNVAGVREMDSVGAACSEFKVPLGDFQRLMLYWNEQLPFHVVDVVEVKGCVEDTALRRTAAEVLFESGIAAPQVEVSSGICTYRAEPCDIEVTTLTPPASSVGHTLAAQSTRELRRPFQLNTDPLIRLWILPSAKHSYVGMTWQHWMGDGMAAGDLLRRILARTCGWSLAPESTLSDWTAANQNAAFAPWFTWRRKIRHLWETVRTIGTGPQVAQLQRLRGDVFEPEVHFLELPDDALERIRRVGGPLQATINDVLVAVAARTLAAALPPSARRWWLRRLRIGNIVDLRPSGGPALQGKGGLFLGLYNIDCPLDPPERWDDLIAIARRQSERAKRLRTYFASLGGFRFARKLWPWVPATWRRPIYTNILRLTGVLTNLRYPETWYTNPIADKVGACYRAVPMGFMYPLVFAVTTLGERLTVTMSCDATGPIADQAPMIKSNMERTIASW